MVIIFFLAYTNVYAADIFSLEEISLDYIKFQGARDYPISLLEGQQLTDFVDLNINIDVLKYFYFNNKIHSAESSTDGDISQFRVVGWEYRIGVRLLSFLDVGLYHYSEHVLDNNYPISLGSPEMTGIELRIYFYKKHKHDSLLDFLD